jgi:hypothetical protein
MNFDGLDDDLDIGYTPTIATNSRSAGMKYNIWNIGSLIEKHKPSPLQWSQKNRMILIC